MRQWQALSATAQDALISAFIFALGAGLYLSGLYPMGNASAQPPLAVRFGVLMLLCALSLFRRRRPLVSLLGGLVPLGVDFALGPTVPVWIIYSDFIYAAVLYGSAVVSRRVTIAAGTLSVIVTIGVLAGTGDWRVFVLSAAAAAAFVGTPIWWALSVRTHKEVAAAERSRAQALGLVAELDRRAAIADERKTMARDLHDVIAGHLSAIALQSEAALGVLNARPADPAMAGILGSIRANSVSALQEMRTMIGLLRRDDGAEDDAVAPRTLAQLPILVDAARSAGIAVRVADALPDEPLPSAVDQAAYRIIQEALTNAMKHAPGQRVEIGVRAGGDTLAVTVRNPTTTAARPSADPDSAHRGLINMRERAAALGGRFTAGPVDGDWSVHAELPLAAAPTRNAEVS
ncbi:sensor histidine kinase [Nocardia puris]|uniref:histidine kinase n=1 Tax=Nocardia puris TaxID=208602 RepID=A0A366E237_9NOCA|nr:histidine kinase [Nocardia puris]MBF6212747.1 sensor histidine kinase [Nocardia puris]MBF6367684.1 sensor histidine kinase [Nocardia puris]MBF6461335.1 sensor histidine kinase [Nocardia puris]RBO96431.1 signal transduction histidine kinase [Nocardia puris]